MLVAPDLVPERAGGADDAIEQVFGDVRVDGGERVVQQVDVGVVVDGASQRDALLLTPGQVDALGNNGCVCVCVRVCVCV